MRLKDCHNFHDFRILAKKRLPSPIFNYIDGGSDDESTYRRNTAAFETCYRHGAKTRPSRLLLTHRITTFVPS